MPLYESTSMTKNTCTLEGCAKLVRTRGLCVNHYHKARRDGTIEVKSVRPGCLVGGCSDFHYAKGYCETHYAALRNHGDPTKRMRGTRGQGSVNKDGYKYMGSGGKLLLEHRLVVESKLGRKLLAHEKIRHRNGIKHDNRLENLEVYEVGSGYLTRGYRMIYVAGKSVLEHRHVMEKQIGRPLLPVESVHHRNGDRSDNRPENLELWSSSQPSGQRVEDKLKWAQEIISLYRPIVGGLDD
jgi:hypothetical protein